jgi:uncharacterized metal-binding protein YceD (DUF177 family)
LNVRPAFDVETPVTEEFLDVDDDIRQNLLLALPAKPLCSPNAKGLCIRCGKEFEQGGLRLSSSGTVFCF